MVFSDCGTFVRVDIDGERLTLTEREVQHAWCQTAQLWDSFHQGTALVTVGNQQMRLTQRQWQILYDQTDKFFDKFFLADIIENEKRIH